MLKIDDLVVRFGGLEAIGHLSLAVEKEELTGLVGPNGAGKTTLFNAISGLVFPKSGRIWFEGKNISRMPLHRRIRLGIGRTFQIPKPLQELTVRENLSVAQYFGAGENNSARIDELLDFLRLSEKANWNAAEELTLMELKALEVGKALATDPKLLLLDEVMAGLETIGKEKFAGTLMNLHHAFPVTMLIIEHDINVIRKMCRRVMVMDFGKLIAQGPAEEVFRHPEVIKSYTGESHA